MKAQRLRVRYRVSEAAATLTHRELMSAWAEGCAAAGLSLAYSQSKRPSPQISLAVPLPLGVTSDCELIDLFLTERADPAGAPARLNANLRQGLEAVAAWEVGLAAPSVQARLRWAEYEVEVPAGPDPAEVQEAIDRLLAAETFPWEHQRETKLRRYDLRPLVLDLRLEGERDGALLVRMRLRAEQEMTGRADQVVAALGLPPARRIHRSRLYVDEVQPAVLAYRRLGQTGG